MSTGSPKGFIMTLIESAIYAPLEKSMQAEIEAIAVEHSNMKNQQVCYFDFKGERYQYSYIRGVRCLMSTLSPSLHPRMNDWLKRNKDILDTEKVYVTGLFRRVLNSSESITDYKRLLPECTHRILDEAGAATYVLPPTLTEEFIKEFLILNEDSINKLKLRMMYTLLG